VWEGPDRLPSLEEVRDPALWIGRMQQTPMSGWHAEVAT
jgi:hypothetical protein